MPGVRGTVRRRLCLHDFPAWTSLHLAHLSVKWRAMIRYAKYHGLGNDYIVLDVGSAQTPTPDQIRLICHRNYGVGGDGVLLPIQQARPGSHGLRIFNPDGSEAEKSGNGLRIFSRYLWDNKLVTDKPFEIDTKGGTVRAHVHQGGESVTVEMGRVSFDSQAIPVAGPPREVLDEDICVLDRTFKFCAATVGNPHCVIPADDVTKDAVLKYGPVIERDSRFPNRTNVQFVRLIGPDNIYIEIWERGAGYTLASGSSSCAAASVAHRLGLCGRHVSVHMPGGCLQVTIDDDWHLTMTGPVAKVCEGTSQTRCLPYAAGCQAKRSNDIFRGYQCSTPAKHCRGFGARTYFLTVLSRQSSLNPCNPSSNPCNPWSRGEVLPSTSRTQLTFLLLAVTFPA